MKENDIHLRKDEHINIALDKEVTGKGISSGFENYRFMHQALPELDFNTISTKTTFLDKQLQVPFLISSMTGGTKRADYINQQLAEAAEEKGWAMGLGSSRIALESSTAAKSFQLRTKAPSIPIFANLGAVQLNKGYGVEACQRIIDLAEADGLVLHVNTLQEIFQDGGDTNFSGLYQKIEALVSALPVPVGVKEVGFGISAETSRRLVECGVHFIDTAGAGGTSWIEVEKHRSADQLKRAAAEAFLGWGIPTSDCIAAIDADSKRPAVLIASGGMKNGVDAAKAIALGADLAGYGRSILKEAVDSADALIEKFEQLETELKIAMFGIGAASIDHLVHSRFLKKK